MSFCAPCLSTSLLFIWRFYRTLEAPPWYSRSLVVICSMYLGHVVYDTTAKAEGKRIASSAPEVLPLKHESRILGQWSYPVCGSRKSQTSSPWAKQHTGLDVCPRILLSCFISKNSDHHQQQQPQLTSLMSYLIAPTSLVPFLGRWPLLATQSLTARGEEGPSWNWRTFFCSIRKSPSVRNTTWKTCKLMRVLRDIRSQSTVIVARMSHWKWRETKQQPSRARSGHQISCCLVSLHFLCDILATITVHDWWYDDGVLRRRSPGSCHRQPSQYQKHKFLLGVGVISALELKEWMPLSYWHVCTRELVWSFGLHLFRILKRKLFNWTRMASYRYIYPSSSAI